MIQFQSLNQAFEYHKCCPSCGSHLIVDSGDFAERVEYSDGHQCQRFAFRMDYKYDDVLYINTFTNEVEFRLTRSLHEEPVYGGGHRSGQTPTYKSYDGMWYQGIITSCHECCQFSYTLQLQVDLGRPKVIGIILNSETISLDDKGVTHEIRNTYTTKQTEYYRTTLSAKEKTITLPLIPLDFNDPKKTLDRIKTLLIFS